MTSKSEGVESDRTTAWIQLISGKPFYPLEPRVEEIEIHDIAWALSMQCRFAGHVKRFYSVAEHCVHLSYAAPTGMELWALLHDAAEAFLVDLPRPIKACLPDYKTIEAQLMECIAAKFGLQLPEPDVIKQLDTQILFNERKALLSPSTQEWELTGTPIPGVQIIGWQPQEAYRKFLVRYCELTHDACY